MFTIEEYLHAKSVGSRHAGKAGSKRTIIAYGTALRTAERLIEKGISEFIEEDADTLMERMQEEGFESAYKANILAALRGAFTWAISNGRYEGSHPFAAISTPSALRKLPRILTTEEVECLFETIRHRKYRLFFQLMYYGGLRIGEVCSLRVEDVVNQGLIVRGKGGKQRQVYLPSKLYERLRYYIETHNDSMYVFSSDSLNGKKDQPMSLVTAYEVFHEAAQKCKLPKDLRPHNLRHSSATHFHEKIGDLAATQKFLGHSRPETTTIYAVISDKRMRAAQQSVFGE